ncbi:MAG: hypothetical protein ABF264_00600 [Flavobacteriales bacterium]
MKYSLILLFLGLSALQSCKVFNPDEIIPSYIYIKDIIVQPNSNQGTSNDNLVDAWVYVDGNLIGTYELPSKIPIHAEGSYNLQIFAGIKKSGLTNLRIQHDFFNSFDTIINSIAYNLDTIVPKVTYESTANIWIEDFEDPGIKFTAMSYSDTVIEITTANSQVFEGNGSGKIEFDASHLFFESRTNETSFNSFPKGGKPVYMELNYKSNEVLTIGIYHNNISGGLVKEEYINLFPTGDEWKKTYLVLTDIVSPQIRATQFEIYIEVQKDKSTAPLVLIDNLKVMY